MNIKQFIFKFLLLIIMKKKKKKQINNDQQLLLLKQKHKSYGQFLSNHKHPNVSINTHSWFFSSKSFHSKGQNYIFNLQNQTDPVKEYFKTVRLTLFPTLLQKNILLKWINSYTDMMNATNKYIKKCRFLKVPIITSLPKLRKELKEEKKIIFNNSLIYDKTINAHTLDLAIKDVGSMYKSAISNVKNTNRPFRIRYIKKNKNKRIVKIEKQYITKDKKSFCKEVFGNQFICSDKDLSKVSSDFTIQYDKNKDTFYLFYAIKPKKTNELRTKQIALDPGVRTFLSGYSNDHHLKIACNLASEIQPILEEIDDINRFCHLKPSKIKKIIAKRELKIKNKIDDMHWKTIKYLTDHYKDVVLGNLSTKQTGENDYLNKMTKRIGSRMRLYVFRERLKYKCAITNTKYLLVNEAYTSKLCSMCGEYYNKNLNNKKTYNCEICKKTIDRDLNGARNIMISSCK